MSIGLLGLGKLIPSNTTGSSDYVIVGMSERGWDDSMVTNLCCVRSPCK